MTSLFASIAVEWEKSRWCQAFRQMLKNAHLKQWNYIALLPLDPYCYQDFTKAMAKSV